MGSCPVKWSMFVCIVRHRRTRVYGILEVQGGHAFQVLAYKIVHGRHQCELPGSAIVWTGNSVPIHGCGQAAHSTCSGASCANIVSGRSLELCRQANQGTVIIITQPIALRQLMKWHLLLWHNKLCELLGCIIAAVA